MERANPPDWIENRPSRGWRALNVRELWRYRNLVAVFAARDLRVRYRQAAFGIAWAAIQPLAGAVVFTLVFSRLAHVGTGQVPYLLFAFVGWAGWTYFANGLGLATQSLVRNANLVTKVYFPRIAAPIAAVLPGLLDLAIVLVVLIPLLLWYRRMPTIALVGLPVGIVALVATTLGAGLVAGSLNVRYRDAGYALGLLTQLWLFASPVAYPSSLVHGGWRYAYAVNPMTGVLEWLRWSLLAGPYPGAVGWVSIGVAVLLLIAGVAVFQRGERRFADVI